MSKKIKLNLTLGLFLMMMIVVARSADARGFRAVRQTEVLAGTTWMNTSVNNAYGSDQSVVGTSQSGFAFNVDGTVTTFVCENIDGEVTRREIGHPAPVTWGLNRRSQLVITDTFEEQYGGGADNGWFIYGTHRIRVTEDETVMRMIGIETQRENYPYIPSERVKILVQRADC